MPTEYEKKFGKGSAFYQELEKIGNTDLFPRSDLEKSRQDAAYLERWMFITARKTPKKNQIEREASNHIPDEQKKAAEDKKNEGFARVFNPLFIFNVLFMDFINACKEHIQGRRKKMNGEKIAIFVGMMVLHIALIVVGSIFLFPLLLPLLPAALSGLTAGITMLTAIVGVTYLANVCMDQHEKKEGNTLHPYELSAQNAKAWEKYGIAEDIIVQMKAYLVNKKKAAANEEDKTVYTDLLKQIDKPNERSRRDIMYFLTHELLMLKAKLDSGQKDTETPQQLTTDRGCLKKLSYAFLYTAKTGGTANYAASTLIDHGLKSLPSDSPAPILTACKNYSSNRQNKPIHTCFTRENSIYKR